jgi:quercetin dioxygenase-like cupin family protein
MNTSSQPTVIHAGTGTELRAFGDVLSVLLSGEHTGKALTVMLDTTPPGGGPPLHCHSREDELFLPVEGRLSYLVDGRWVEVAPGGAVFLPRGSAHCYRNIGTVPSKHWILTLPSGFETFFSRAARMSLPKPRGLT